MRCFKTVWKVRKSERTLKSGLYYPTKEIKLISTDYSLILSWSRSLFEMKKKRNSTYLKVKNKDKKTF